MQAPLSVKVTVVEAQALAIPEGKEGVYFRVILVPLKTTNEEKQKKKGKKTKSVPATAAKWDKTFEIDCLNQQHKIVFQCWCTGADETKVLLGAAEVSMESLVPNSANDKWLALKSDTAGTRGGCGLLHAKISFAPKRSLSTKKLSPVLAYLKGDPSALKKRCPSFEPGALDQYIPKFQLEKLSEEERERQKAILEFIETERSYLADLDILCKVFYQPINERKLLDKGECVSLFSNVQTIRDVSAELLQELDQEKNNNPVIQNLGRLLSKKDAMFKLYAIYCSAQTDANHRIEELKLKHPDFSKFLEECFARPECRLLPFDSFLHAPLQRLVKYPLLLNAIIKHTPPDHEDRQPLERVLDTIMEIVNMVNERTRQVENVQALMKLQEKIENTQDGNDFVDNHRFIMVEADFFVIITEGRRQKERQKHFILFNDQLVICNISSKKTNTKYKVVQKIPIKQVVVEENQEPDRRSKKAAGKVQRENSFVIKDEKCIIEVYTSSREEKTNWMQKIKAAIESVDDQRFNFRSTTKDKRETAVSNETVDSKEDKKKGKKKSKDDKKKDQLDKKKKKKKEKNNKQEVVISAPTNFTTSSQGETAQKMIADTKAKESSSVEDLKEKRIKQLLAGKQGRKATVDLPNKDHNKNKSRQNPQPRLGTGASSTPPTSPRGGEGRKVIRGVGYTWRPNPKGKGYIFVREESEPPPTSASASASTSASESASSTAQPTTGRPDSPKLTYEERKRMEMEAKAEVQRQRMEKVRQAVEVGLTSVYDKLQEQQRAIHDPTVSHQELIAFAKRLRELKKELGIYGLTSPRDNPGSVQT